MGIEGFFLVLAGILTAGILASCFFFFRRKRRAALLTVVLTLIVAGGWYPLPVVDKIASVVFFPHDTIYAPHYSDEAFNKVRVGQHRQKILALLGEPLERGQYQDDGTEYWYYSRHGPRYDNYWNKIVVFDVQRGQVIRKVDELDPD